MSDFLEQIVVDTQAVLAALQQPTVTRQNSPNPPKSLDIATKMVQLGAHVIFIERGKKGTTEPGWQDKATRDMTIIAERAAQNPTGNIGVVAKPDGLWFFDDDQNILAEYESKHGVIPTYRVRSVSGGTHLYFKQNDLSRSTGNLNGVDQNGKETWSMRALNRYVLAAGSSAHPNNDETQPETYYQAIDKNAAPIEAPERFIRFLKDKTVSRKKVTTDQTTEVVEGGRNRYLTSYLGGLRQNAKMDEQQLLSAGLLENDKVCRPPLSDHEVRTIAKSIARYEVKPAPPVIMGGKPIGDTEPALVPAQIHSIPYPVFPTWVFGGIPAFDKWVKPFCKINSRYPEYMMLPLMVLILNYLSTKQVRIEYKGFPLSIYLLLVGRKGRVIKTSSAQDAMEFCQRMGILNYYSDAINNSDAKTLVFTMGSSEGLGMAMSRTNCKSAVLFYDEFSKLIAKMGIENSSFANDLSTCYESGRFANGTKSRKEGFNHDPGTYCLSLIGCTTEKRYPRLAAKLFGSVDGMDERFFVLYQPEVLREVEPMVNIPIPDDVVQETKALVDRAVEKQVYSIDDSEPLRAISKLGNRIEIRAEKWALAFAVLLGRDSIDEGCIERGIALAKYENQAKHYLQVGEAITREGTFQREIRLHAERAGGKIKLRDLQRLVRHDDIGTDNWRKLYGGLLSAGILSESGAGGHRWDPKIVTVLVPLMRDDDED
jgi:hypothetical protein